MDLIREALLEDGELNVVHIFGLEHAPDRHERRGTIRVLPKDLLSKV